VRHVWAYRQIAGLCSQQYFAGLEKSIAHDDAISRRTYPLANAPQPVAGESQAIANAIM